MARGANERSYWPFVTAVAESDTAPTKTSWRGASSDGAGPPGGRGSFPSSTSPAGTSTMSTSRASRASGRRGEPKADVVVDGARAACRAGTSTESRPGRG